MDSSRLKPKTRMIAKEYYICYTDYKIETPQDSVHWKRHYTSHEIIGAETERSRFESQPLIQVCCCFSQFLQVNADTVPWVLNNPFFPNPFQLTVYQPNYHSMLYSLGYVQRHKTLHHEKSAIQVVPASKPHVMKAHGTRKSSYVASRWVSGLFQTSDSFITIHCPLERGSDGPQEMQ
jgi:hypothetical protein